MVQKIGGQADGGIRDSIQCLRSQPHLVAVGDAYPTLGDVPIAEIKRRAIIDLLDRIEDGKLINKNTGEPIRGGAVMAQSTLAVVRKIMDAEATAIADSVEKRLRATARFRNAVKLIAPSPEQAAECEQRLLYALANVLLAEGWIDNLPTPAKMRDILAEKILTLRNIEKDSLFPKSFRDQARRQRERLEKLADENKVQPGSKQVNSAKLNAVHFASHLLADFGKGPAGLTRGGRWHTLAQIVFGDTETDLFDYMQYYKHHLPESPPELLVAKRFSGLLVRAD